jgi:opacity protein-like surface antigen
MANMSLITKLQSALSVVFILTTAGAISVTAQTPAAADSSLAKPVADAVSTSEPNKESKKLPNAPLEKTSPNSTSAVSRDLGEADALEVAAGRSVTAKTVTLTKTEVPRSPQAADADNWQFQFSPYFWLASLHGTAGVGNRTTQVDMSFGDIFGSLKFALMGVFEARKGKFILLTDMEYVSIEDDKATPGPFFSDVTARFKTFIFDPEVGYRVFDNPAKGQSIDLLGGIRVWHVSTELDFGAGILPATQIQGSRNWVDAIVGLRGKTALSEKVFVSGKFDLGGGGSKFTWQFFGGLGYNIKPNIALIGGYRVLDVNYDKNNFVYDMNQRGPIMGMGFKF